MTSLYLRNLDVVTTRGYFLTTLVVAALSLGCVAKAANAAGGLKTSKTQVFGGFASDNAMLRSVMFAEDGTEVPHGLHVTTDHGWMRDAAVYNRGVLVRHHQFHRNGVPFITRHIGADGDGHISVYNTRSDTVYVGHVRGGKRWEGQFLEREWISGTYGEQQLMLKQFRDGEQSSSEPFPFASVGIATPGDSSDPTEWHWAHPGWPEPAMLSGTRWEGPGD